MRSTAWATRPPKDTFSAVQVTEHVFRWHHHDDLEIFSPEHGSGKVVIGDYVGEFQAGELYLVGAFLPHMFYAVGDTPKLAAARASFVLNMRPEIFASQHPALPELAALSSRARRGLVFRGDVAAQGQGLLRELVAQRGRGLRAYITLLSLLELLAKNRARATRLCSPGFDVCLRDDMSARVDRICRYVHEHYASELRLEDIARAVHLSPAALCRLFKRATGRTLMAYANELRVGQACRLLAETEQPISFIALDVGYETLSNFNRMFRRVKRTTPSLFRRKMLRQKK